MAAVCPEGQQHEAEGADSVPAAPRKPPASLPKGPQGCGRWPLELHTLNFGLGLHRDALLQNRYTRPSGPVSRALESVARGC